MSEKAPQRIENKSTSDADLAEEMAEIYNPDTGRPPRQLTLNELESHREERIEAVLAEKMAYAGLEVPEDYLFPAVFKVIAEKWEQVLDGHEDEVDTSELLSNKEYGGRLQTIINRIEEPLRDEESAADQLARMDYQLRTEYKLLANKRSWFIGSTSPDNASERADECLRMFEGLYPKNTDDYEGVDEVPDLIGLDSETLESLFTDDEKDEFREMARHPSASTEEFSEATFEYLNRPFMFQADVLATYRESLDSIEAEFSTSTEEDTVK